MEQLLYAHWSSIQTGPCTPMTRGQQKNTGARRRSTRDKYQRAATEHKNMQKILDTVGQDRMK